jgi:hypothetical protein
VSGETLAAAAALRYRGRNMAALSVAVARRRVPADEGRMDLARRFVSTKGIRTPPRPGAAGSSCCATALPDPGTRGGIS